MEAGGLCRSAGVFEVWVRANGYVLELKDQDEKGGFIKEGERFRRRLQWVSETEESATERVLRDSFVLVPAGMRMENGFELGKCFCRLE